MIGIFGVSVKGSFSAIDTYWIRVNKLKLNENITV